MSLVDPTTSNPPGPKVTFIELAPVRRQRTRLLMECRWMAKRMASEIADGLQDT
jgi:hypothetical protein